MVLLAAIILSFSGQKLPKTEDDIFATVRSYEKRQFFEFRVDSFRELQQKYT